MKFSKRRRHGQVDLDEFGAFEIFLATSGTFAEPQQFILMKYLTDDDFLQQALQYATKVSEDKKQSLTRSNMIAFEDASALGPQESSAYPHLEFAAAQRFIARNAQVVGNGGDSSELKTIAITGIRGAAKMFQLRRKNQAAETITFCSTLLCYLLQRNSVSDKTYVATWGSNHENSCTFTVAEGGEIKVTPQIHDSTFLADHYVEWALTELQISLGLEPVFKSQVDEMNELTLNVLSNLSGDSNDGNDVKVSAPFHWQPPLPHTRATQSK